MNIFIYLKFLEHFLFWILIHLRQNLIKEPTLLPRLLHTYVSYSWSWYLWQSHKRREAEEAAAALILATVLSRSYAGENNSSSISNKPTDFGEKRSSKPRTRSSDIKGKEKNATRTMYRAIEMKNERQMNLHIFLPSWHIILHHTVDRESEVQKTRREKPLLGGLQEGVLYSYMFVDGWIYFLIRKRNELLVCAWFVSSSDTIIH